MIDVTKIYYFIFGVLTIAGGAMGYIKAGSKASLIFGGILGILLIVAGVLLRDKVNPGLILGGIVSIAIVGKFLPAFLQKHNWMPAGMMAVLGSIAIILTAVALLKR